MPKKKGGPGAGNFPRALHITDPSAFRGLVGSHGPTKVTRTFPRALGGTELGGCASRALRDSPRANGERTIAQLRQSIRIATRANRPETVPAARFTVVDLPEEPNPDELSSRPPDGTTCTILCQGCGDNADDGRPRIWIQCDACDIWMHGECVGRLSVQQCAADFTCRSCQINEQGEEPQKLRAARQSSSRKQCTPFCAPPGCVEGKGCMLGMGQLRELDYERIFELVRAEIDAMHKYLKTPGIDGEEAVYEPGPNSRYMCTVHEWFKTTCGIEYTSNGKTHAKLVPCTSILRFPPQLTKAELADLAIDFGLIRCPWDPAKQLQYEMRKARRAWKLRTPQSRAAYVASGGGGGAGGTDT